MYGYMYSNKPKHKKTYPFSNTFLFKNANPAYMCFIEVGEKGFLKTTKKQRVAGFPHKNLVSTIIKQTKATFFFLPPKL